MSRFNDTMWQSLNCPLFSPLTLNSWYLSHMKNTTQMTQVEINTAISEAFLNLSTLNEDLYDYYVNRLYTVDGDFVKEEWTEKTLSQMEDDVMHNSWTISWKNTFSNTATLVTSRPSLPHLSIRHSDRTLVILLVTSSLIRYHLTDEKESIYPTHLSSLFYTLPILKV